jgi:hypothetical protein
LLGSGFVVQGRAPLCSFLFVLFFPLPVCFGVVSQSPFVFVQLRIVCIMCLGSASVEEDFHSWFHRTAPTIWCMEVHIILFG